MWFSFRFVKKINVIYFPPIVWELRCDQISQEKKVLSSCSLMGTETNVMVCCHAKFQIQWIPVEITGFCSGKYVEQL